MKRILLLGKMNDVLKELNKALTDDYRVQIGSENVEMLSGLITVAEPDLIIISLVGIYEDQEMLFRRIRSDYPSIPVITVGTEEEKKRFLQFYDGVQFENLIRPIDNKDVLNAVIGKIGEGSSGGEEDAGAGAKKTVLVVDDNGPTLRTIKGMLEDRYNVMIAPSGMKAMTSMGKRKPDIILLDYEMPVCDGRQTLEMIRADDELSDIPVIFLTGVNNKENIEAVLSLKLAGYLLKPPVKDKIVEYIEKALGES